MRSTNLNYTWDIYYSRAYCVWGIRLPPLCSLYLRLATVWHLVNSKMHLLPEVYTILCPQRIHQKQPQSLLYGCQRLNDELYLRLCGEHILLWVLSSSVGDWVSAFVRGWRKLALEVAKVAALPCKYHGIKNGSHWKWLLPFSELRIWHYFRAVFFVLEHNVGVRSVVTAAKASASA